jgi:hypothetical protein
VGVVKRYTGSAWVSATVQNQEGGVMTSAVFTERNGGVWETGSPPQVMTSASAAMTASRSPAVTFTGYTPQAFDVVVLYPRSPAVSAITVPTGWVNPLGGNAVASTGTDTLCCVYHLVTTAEASAATVTYTATNLFNANVTDTVQAVVVRGVDSASVVDAVATATGASVTPHVLAGLSGADLANGSLVISSLSSEGPRTYSASPPTDWTYVRNDATSEAGRAVLSRNTLTTANTNVSATNVTPSAADEYTSITVAFNPIGAQPPPGPPPDPTDGVQAAVVFGWGSVIDGDEFSTGSTPDPVKWSLYNGAGHGGNGLRVPSAWSVANGILTCTGLANGNTGGMAWHGGGRGSSVTYRDEARVRLYNTASDSGSQYHPVLIRWPNSDVWPQGGEDDYMETNIGSTGVQAFIHWPNQSSGSAQSSASKTIDITQWHNYAIERSSTGIKGFIDGVQWFSFTLAQTNGQVPGPMHPTIQLDNFGGTTHRVAKMDVAWYRMYNSP